MLLRRNTISQEAILAEATLRRVHAAEKDDEMPPIEAILARLNSSLLGKRLLNFKMITEL